MIHGRRIVGQIVVDAEQPARALEYASSACEVAAPFFAAMQPLRNTDARDTLALHLAELAHDMRRPLSTVRISLDLLRRPDATERDASTIDRCRRAVGEIEELVEDVLALNGAPAPREVRMATLVSELADEEAAHLKLAGIVLVLRIVEDVTVLGDAHNLRRAIGNVLSNAVSASPRGGTVHVTIDGDLDTVFIEVRDQGPGVPEALREKVFEPYFTTRKSGTGLGLAVTRAVAQAHGGSVRFVDGAGGIVELRLPRRRSNPS
jgi:signal transduction histidine kinase